MDKKKMNELKRKRRDTYGYGSNEDISDIEDDDTKKFKPTKRESKDGNNANLKHADVAKLQGQSASAVIKKLQDDRNNNRGPGGAQKKREEKAKSKTTGGHRVVASGATYKSDKGKGDVLKAGKHEPYAYYQLNPDMLNPRKKKQAI